MDGPARIAGVLFFIKPFFLKGSSFSFFQPQNSGPVITTFLNGNCFPMFSHEYSYNTCGHNHKGRKGVPVALLNGPLQELLMGVQTPIPPKMINAAAPEGAPPRRINLLRKKTVICPAVPKRGPEAGSPHKITLLFNDFHGFGVNPRSCAFLQSTFFYNFNCTGTNAVIMPVSWRVTFYLPDIPGQHFQRLEFPLPAALPDNARVVIDMLLQFRGRG